MNNNLLTFTKMQTYINDKEYLFIAKIDNIDYFTPDDESMGGIVAVNWENKLVYCTGFYEMDDMEIEDSDYKIVFCNGELLPAFECHGVDVSEKAGVSG